MFLDGWVVKVALEVGIAKSVVVWQKHFVDMLREVKALLPLDVLLSVHYVSIIICITTNSSKWKV